MLSFFVVRTKKLISKDDPFFSMTTLAKENESIDLWQLGFMFAIDDIDPRIGHLTATHTRWNNDDEGKIDTPIKMVPCSELLQGGNFEQGSNNEAFILDNILKGRKDTKFICPVELDSMVI